MFVCLLVCWVGCCFGCGFACWCFGLLGELAVGAVWILGGLCLLFCLGLILL